MVSPLWCTYIPVLNIATIGDTKTKNVFSFKYSIRKYMQKVKDITIYCNYNYIHKNT